MITEKQHGHRVIFVHGTLGLGGAEVLRLSVLEELMHRQNYDIRVCVLRQPGPLADRVTDLGIPIDVLGNRGGLFDVAGTLRLARYLRRNRPDVAQASQFLTNLQTRLAAWLGGRPTVIIEEHGIYRWKRWYHRLLDRMVNRRADAVIACSHRVAESAAELLGCGTNEITVIHNCASASQFESLPDGVADRTRREIAGESSFVVSVVGTLRWEKGHEYLLEAWKMLIADERLPADAQLWIIGEGPLGSKLRDIADDCSGVVFVGRSDDPRPLLAASDLFVLPSVNEGFGIAIVEAMCAGLPVVATDSGGIPEVIDQERTGLLVPIRDGAALADAIERLYAEPALREKLAQAGRQEAEARFTPKRYVDQLSNLYDGLNRR